jgi:hypothetical protein
MAYKYCIATNWGKDFFTARERMNFYLSGHPANVWVVGDNLYGAKWIKKVNGVLKTKDEAQAIVDAEVLKAQQAFDALPEEQKQNRQRPTNIILK